MSPSTSDRNLLFGILAVQMDFISRDQLIAAMNAWVLDKSKSLGAILIEQKALEAGRHALLEALVSEHLKQHDNDPHKSLAAVSSLGSMRGDLQKITDADLEKSLGHLSLVRQEDDLYATATHTVGESTSAGTRFRILRPHARGGLGEVFVAHDEELHREVALKEIQDRHADHPENRARFLLEAEITGGLEHPGIVPVYGLGQYADGRPFYAMRFIRGDSLKDAIERFHKVGCVAGPESDRTTNPPMRRTGNAPYSGERIVEFRKLLGRFIDVCNAIAYAHSRGVLHRDLKPGNIMLGKYGETLVVDWGLAKAVDRPDTPSALDEHTLRPSSASGSAETQAGTAIGTPQFMSPEQAAGRLDLLGPASDVYSLGATLYCLLTGKALFEGKDLGAVLQQVQRGEFPRPTRIKADVPRALEAICLKAMALAPQDRYASPRDLADDIEHWLADEAVGAFREPSLARMGRWVRKHKSLASLSAAAVIILATVAVASVLIISAKEHADSENVLRQEAEAAGQAEAIQRKAAEAARRAEAVQRGKAEDALDLAERNSYIHSIFLADLALKQNNVPLAQQRLKECKPALRNWEWRYLNSRCHMELFRSPISTKFTANGKQLVIRAPGEVQIYDAYSLEKVFAFKAPDGGITVCPDGMRLAVSASYREPKLHYKVHVFNARTGKELLTLGGVVRQFSPDGRRVALVNDYELSVYEIATGQKTLAITTMTNWPDNVLFSHDGTRLAFKKLVGDNLHALCVLDTQTGKEIYTSPRAFGTAALSPDGTLFAEHAGGTLNVFDGRTGRDVVSIRDPVKDRSSVRRVIEFSPDGNLILVSLADSLGFPNEAPVRILTARTGQEISAIKGRSLSAIFSPDGTRVAAWQPISGGDRVVRLFDARTGTEVLALKGPTPLHLPTFSPDGTRIAAVGADLMTHVFDARPNRKVLTLEGHLYSAKFSPDGKRIAAIVQEQLRVFDLETGREEFTAKGQRDFVAPTKVLQVNHGFSPNGKRIAATRPSKNGTELRVIGVPTSKEMLTIQIGQPGFSYPLFSPDGSQIALTNRNDDTEIIVLDSRTGKESYRLKGPNENGWTPHPVFSPDGTKIAAQFGKGGVRVHDAKTGEEKLRLELGRNPVFSSDGTLIAIIAQGSGSHSVRVFNAKTGAMVYDLKQPGMPIFSPSGRRIALVSGSGGLALFDGHTGLQIAALKAPISYVAPPVFSPDGTRIAVQTADGVLRLYDTNMGQEVLSLGGHALMSFPVFSRDGTRIAVADGDPRGFVKVRIYEAPHDITSWSKNHRESMAHGSHEWHRSQAATNEKTGQWYAAAFHLSYLIAAEPANGHHHFRRGYALLNLGKEMDAKKEFAQALEGKKDLQESQQADAHAMLGQWHEAARLYGKIVEDAPQHGWFPWTRHALLHLQQEDQGGYRKACAEMLKFYGKWQQADGANAIAWTCVLKPEALPAMAPALELAERAVRADSSNWAYQNTHGAVLYRAGRYKEALAALERSLKYHSEGGHHVDFVFLAMIYHNLGKATEARQALEKSKQLLEKNPPRFWTDQVEAQLFQREAKALIEGKAKTKPAGQ